MNKIKPIRMILCALGFLLLSPGSVAQSKETKKIEPGVYRSEGPDGNIHDLVVTDSYLVANSYHLNTPEFEATLGGPYVLEEGKIVWDLDFNSKHDQDGIEDRAIPYEWNGKTLNLKGDRPREFKPLKNKSQNLDGVWYFATRGPDEGQERRSPNQARRTLKILQDGHFQWVAFNSDTFEFFGTGGGTYRTDNGNYMEHIRFFSRDSERVGDRLDFKYEISGGDWHHRGKNSRGEPMYEIWSRL